MSHHNLKSLQIYIDGAARGNPGPAGIGVVLCDMQGQTVANIGRYIGETTNNVAEYNALVIGLEEALRLKAKELTINTDSELLAKQLGGEYKIKSPALKGLYAKAQQLLEGLDEVRVNQIPRAENKGADRLANQAIDAAGRKRAGTSFILKSKDKIPETLF